MSTQNFHQDADNAVRSFALFFILSMVIHVAMVWSFLAFSSVYNRVAERVFPKEPEALTVDVVELPPASGEPQKALRPPKGGITRYAERTNVVEKETFPESKKTGPARPGIIIPPQAKASSGPAPGAQKANGAIKEAPASGSASGASGTAGGGEGILKGQGRLDEEYVGTGIGSGIGTGVGTGGRGSASKAEGGTGRPGLFLPGETISELARKYEAESPAGEQGKTLNLNTTELRYANYLINMKRRIELYWEYPEVASRNGWHGRLFINFTIEKNGALGEITLAKSSGYPVLDDAAMTALKLAAPFSAFPENFGIDQINIKGQFEYAIVYSRER